MIFIVINLDTRKVITTVKHTNKRFKNNRKYFLNNHGQRSKWQKTSAHL
jgi:hypothetical protein